MNKQLIPPYWGTVGNRSTETCEWSVCQLLKDGRKWHVFIIFCSMPGAFLTEIRGAWWKLHLAYFLLWYCKDKHTSSSWRTSFSMPQLHCGDTGLLKKHLKSLAKPETKLWSNFPTWSSFLSYTLFVSTPTLTAATTHWKVPPAFTGDYPSLPAELLTRVLPNLHLSKPNKLAKAITAKRSQKETWPTGEGEKSKTVLGTAWLLPEGRCPGSEWNVVRTASSYF